LGVTLTSATAAVIDKLYDEMPGSNEGDSVPTLVVKELNNAFCDGAREKFTEYTLWFTEF